VTGKELMRRRHLSRRRRLHLDPRPPHECVQVREGGEILDRVKLDRACFACILGGPTGGRCSSWWPTGEAPTRWGTRSRVGPGRSSVAGRACQGAGWP
jgi:hypothetical protein